MLRYSSPLTQVVIVGLICFLTSGMFNALNGMGGGGQLNTEVAANANVALYTCFAVGGLFAGPIVNKIGPSLAMALGGLTYALYSGSLLYYNHQQQDGFPIASGAILGLGAALLWTGQGAIMLSYPSESNKGEYIGIFWVIFNLGGVIGSIIPLALNWNSTAGSVNDGTYIGFIILMGLGSLMALLLLSPHKVTRDDGQPVIIQQFPSWKEEITGVLKIFLDWKMLALFPMFIASNWFYAYQFNGVNAFYFNVRTRAFNSLWYWTAQILAAFFFGKLLDWSKFGRKSRGILGISYITIILMGAWIGGLFFQLTYKREDPNINMDLYNPSYFPRIILFIVYGLFDSVYQCFAYWIMGALTNDTNVLARYAGYYKAVQSAGGAISWRIDAVGTSYLVQLIICWALLAISIPFAFLVVLNIKQTNYDSKSIKEKVAATNNSEISA
ncbi:major facilitator superfamily domain-containing protein [Gigaspora rosea]|uniref:Major facilitator superfamily domain-containing protein n=1 Tax=Gigaspora rosea TaxID=44941 RepID=A0A397VRJ2_9GLOM|nr:major facilitator superfamily domain-containing protein [Gigaspora rosea]